MWPEWEELPALNLPSPSRHGLLWGHQARALHGATPYTLGSFDFVLRLFLFPVEFHSVHSECVALVLTV